MARVGVFIEWWGLVGGIGKNHPGYFLDYRKFRDYLRANDEVIFAGVYSVDYSDVQGDLDKREDNRERTAKIAKRLKGQGFQYIAKPAYRMGQNGEVQKQVLVELAGEACLLAATGKIDRLILVSGNREFQWLIERLGPVPYCVKTTVINPFDGNTLRQAADEFIALSDIADQILGLKAKEAESIDDDV